MDDRLLGVRGGKPVGKCWAARFVTRSAKLKMGLVKLRIGRGYCRRI
jgi:hypothetical protein